MTEKLGTEKWGHRRHDVRLPFLLHFPVINLPVFQIRAPGCGGKTGKSMTEK
jgi:hypothetical protein